MPPIPAAELRHRNHDIIHDLKLDGYKDLDGNDKVKVIGLNGKWYDITNFIDKHPGGEVIEHFIGKDATAAFKAYGHDENLLVHRKVVGTYSLDGRHPADVEFEELVDECRRRGYFVSDKIFYVKKSLVCLGFWLTALTCLKVLPSWCSIYMAGGATALFFQQSAFIMHDFMHSQIAKSSKVNRFFGVIFGTTFFGISAHWWRDEHILHHALTNVVDYSKKWVDPQMWESVWAQNAKLYPFFVTKLQSFLVSIQHITFVPVVVLIGRFEIVIDSMRQERRWYEWVGFFFHWVWMSYFISHIPTWPEVVLFYLTVAWIEGWFHFQLILSHYCKMFMTIDEFHASSWYIYQVLSNMNISTPRWQDWYYGGLNYHIEHHIFPRMSRKYLRTVSRDVRRICEKYNIDYDMCSFTTALTKTLKHLKMAAVHYKLDPR